MTLANWFLALGLATSFAVVGTFLSLLLLNMGLHPDVLRQFAAMLLPFIGLVLLVKPLEEWISLRLPLGQGVTSGQDLPLPEGGAGQVSKFR